MKILGNRVLVSRIAEEVKEGFNAVDVVDSFINIGKIEMLGDGCNCGILVGNTIMFAKYSPDTQEVELEGKKMKIINVDDILAIL